MFNFPNLTPTQKARVCVALMLIGALLLLIGELHNAVDALRGGTISEWFWSLPPWVRAIIIFLLGVIANHLLFGWDKPESAKEANSTPEVA